MFYFAIHQSEDVTSGPPPEHEDPVCLIFYFDEADMEFVEEKVAAVNAELQEDEEYNHYLYLQPVKQPMFVDELLDKYPGLDELTNWLSDLCAVDHTLADDDDEDDFDDDFDDDFEDDEDDFDDD